MPTPELVDGQRTWSLVRDVEGHRTYKLKLRVKTAINQGPATAIQCPGLPVPGSLWIVDADIDIYAWCRWECNVTPVVENEPNELFDLEFMFSTKPTELRKCKTTQFEDPLLEPQKISGSNKSHTEEVMYDRYGDPIVNSAWETVRGPGVEFEYSTPQVVIEQNVALLQLGMCNQMCNTVNDSTLWGLPARTIKLSDFSWEKKFYGTCSAYYTRRFTFDSKYRITGTGRVENWDRVLADEGGKVLNGQWNVTTGAWTLLPINGEDPDPNNPAHFIRFKDRAGENARTLLDGLGTPADTVVETGSSSSVGSVGAILVDYYPQTNFLLLGIPVVL